MQLSLTAGGPLALADPAGKGACPLPHDASPQPRQTPSTAPPAFPRKGHVNATQLCYPDSKTKIDLWPRPESGEDKNNPKVPQGPLPTPPSRKAGQHTDVGIAGLVVLAPCLPLSHEIQLPKQNTAEIGNYGGNGKSALSTGKHQQDGKPLRWEVVPELKVKPSQRWLKQVLVE